MAKEFLKPYPVKLCFVDDTGEHVKAFGYISHYRPGRAFQEIKRYIAKAEEYWNCDPANLSVPVPIPVLAPVLVLSLLCHVPLVKIADNLMYLHMYSSSESYYDAKRTIIHGKVLYDVPYRIRPLFAVPDEGARRE